MTYRVWSKKTNEILDRSAVRSKQAPNINLSKTTSPEGELSPLSANSSTNDDTYHSCLPIYLWRRPMIWWYTQQYHEPPSLGPTWGWWTTLEVQIYPCARTGELTEKPLDRVITDDPVSVAQYAKKNNLLNMEQGWKRLKWLAKRDPKITRMVNQAKLWSLRPAPKYKYGYKVPRDNKHAVELDKKNGGNTKCQDAIWLELKQLDEYRVFIEDGVFHINKLPPGYQLIKVHLVFAIKCDGRHKARMVAVGGHLTQVPVNSVYGRVLSLHRLRLCLFLGKINNMESYDTEIGSAYLESTTNEKVSIKGGPEFGPIAGHLLIIYNALYGLQSSGKEFGDLLAACLRELGFTPSKAELQIFIRKSSTRDICESTSMILL